MNKKEKKQFIKNIMKDTTKKLLSHVDKMPEEWDDLELRQLIEDDIKTNVNYVSMGSVRKRKYTHIAVTRNLF